MKIGIFMRLQYGISINLALLACLSSFMLALGQSESYYFLPALTFIASILSVYFTDIRKTFRLSGFLSNVIVMIVVLISLGDLVRTRAELLAIAIARVLVLVQVVLLFREKGTRERWHILLISFLQVVVASVFQQSLVFGGLLLVYTFVGLCAFSLIFLQSENTYFKRHSFLRKLIAIRKEELSEQQDYNRLIKIMMATLIAGPLSLVLHYRANRNEHESEHESQENDSIWEESEDDEIESKLPRLQDINSRESGDDRSVRWPLLYEKPQFSGGTTRKTGLIGGQWELISRLAWSTLFSLVFGIIVFAVVPRFGEVEIFGWSFSHDRWQSRGGPASPLNTVGFSEEVRLGSLGNVSQNYQEVLSVRFLDYGNENNIVFISRFRDRNTAKYEKIDGNYFYLRGIALDRYENKRWYRQSIPDRNIHDFFDLRDDSFYPKYVPGEFVSGSSELFFAPNTDLVMLNCTVYPLNTPILFTVWPFFQDRNADNRFMVRENRVLRQDDSRENTTRARFITTGFRNGVQLDLIPNQEVRLDSSGIPWQLLDFSEDAMPSLARLARKWDEESGLDKKDFIARAKFLERKLSESPEFSYKLGGTIREAKTDPLEDFVRNNPSGHCEYFAGTLAMMLRSVGIPSRLINGYKTPANPSFESERGFSVRQCDAHSWVEAFIPDESLPSECFEGNYSEWWYYGGWLRLDPTPSSEDTILTHLFSFYEWRLWIENFWVRNVLNMNSRRQVEYVYQPILDFFSYVKNNVLKFEFWKTVWNDTLERYKEIFRGLRGGNWQFTDFILLGLPVLIIAVIIWVVFRFLLPRIYGLFGNRISPEERRRLATVEFYLRMEKLLARSGLVRKPAETQRQFAVRSAAFLLSHRHLNDSQTESLSDPILLENASKEIAESFYKVRYGDHILETSERERIEKHLEIIENNLS